MIIGSLKRDNPPQYRGVYEFEFLSEHIADMMVKLQKSHDSLEKRVRERTAELEESRLVAETASRYKSEFLANMSHEIRTPLSGIIGMTDLAMDTALDEQQKIFMQSIQAEATALNNLISDILDLSKIEAGKVVLEEIPYDLHCLLDDFTDSFAFRMEKKEIHFSSFMSPDVFCQVIGDPGRLRQILVNLTGNALKFTPKGGEVFVKCEMTEDHGDRFEIRFTVKDTGIGVPKEQQEMIFESFTQADGSTTRKYGGTGLGTAISKQLTEMMGGEIGLRSEKGKGSEFWFKVLLKKQTEPTQRLTGGDHDLTGLRILIADDNPASRFVVIEYLRSWGCLPAEAACGKEVLDMLRESVSADTPFNLVIADLKMSSMDGFDLAVQIKACEALAKIPIIVLTSLGNRGDGKQCRDLKISGYLTKPVKVGEMQKAIKMVLGLAPSRPDQSQPLLVTKHVLKEEEKKSVLILLAEDYPTNQKVTMTHLQKAGHQVDLAENGEQAVEAFKQRHYDLILMDIQMPVLDGYQATRKIRELETNVKSGRTSIIALTANAMIEDREKCFEAGMDDYITKPLRKTKLLELVDRWTMPAIAEQGKTDFSSASTENKVNSCALPMDFKKAVKEFEGDGDLVMEVISEFLQIVKAQVGTISLALAEANSEVVRKEAHSIKGGAANITAHSLSRAAVYLEDIGKSGVLEEGNSALGVLKKEIHRLEHYYHKELKDHGDSLA